MTTMIACVSPLEYNISETINTINYASRARRIKNSVRQNQSEVGWDDIDYLRNTVLKLRTKISSLEANPGAAARSAGRFESSVDEEALARQVMELTDKLADLEDDFSHVSIRVGGRRKRLGMGGDICSAWRVLVPAPGASPQQTLLHLPK